VLVQRSPRGVVSHPRQKTASGALTMCPMETLLRICDEIGDWLEVGLRLICQDFGIEDPIWLVILAVSLFKGSSHLR
jgi:hypothetical protein